MPTPPAPAWISTRSPGSSAGEVDQAVVGGEEDDGTAAACSKLQPSGIGTSSWRSRDRKRREGGVEVRPITRSPGARSVTSAPTSTTTPGAFAAERAPRRAPRSRGRSSDVAEVEPGGVHLDPHLVGPKRLGGTGVGNQREALQGAALERIEAPGARRGKQRAGPVCGRDGPRRQRHAPRAGRAGAPRWQEGRCPAPAPRHRCRRCRSEGSDRGTPTGPSGPGPRRRRGQGRVPPPRRWRSHLGCRSPGGPAALRQARPGPFAGRRWR